MKGIKKEKGIKRMSVQETSFYKNPSSKNINIISLISTNSRGE